MLTWGTRPATSPPNTLRAIHRTGQATQGQRDFPFDALTIIMTDSYTRVVLYIFEVAFLATVNSRNYKERKEKDSEVNTLLTINKEDNGHLRDGFIIHCITTARILFAFLFIFEFGNLSKVTKTLFCTRKQYPERL